MNCKQGDLAILVRSNAGNEGKLFRCAVWLGSDHYGPAAINDVWHAVTLQRVTSDVGSVYEAGDLVKVSDSQLRPIRDPGDDAVDEMLLIVPSPAVLEAL
jgi:hypothetical protein